MHLVNRQPGRQLGTRPSIGHDDEEKARTFSMYPALDCRALDAGKTEFAPTLAIDQHHEARLLSEHACKLFVPVGTG